MKISDTAGLRGFLIEQMTGVAEGKIDVGQAKSICNLAQQVYNTVKLEMTYSAMKAKGSVTSIESVKWAPENKTKNLRAA